MWVVGKFIVSHGRVAKRKENLLETYKDSPNLVTEAFETKISSAWLHKFTGYKALTRASLVHIASHTHTHTHIYIFTFFTTQTLRNLHTRNRPIDCTCNVLMIISNYKIPKIEKIFFFDISRMLKKTMHGFTKLINNPRPSTLQNAVAI